MKITALKEHRCFCCSGVIKKGEECFVFIVNPENPSKNEFDVICAPMSPFSEKPLARLA